MIMRMMILMFNNDDSDIDDDDYNSADNINCYDNGDKNQN